MMQHRTEADIVFEHISGDYPVWERAVREAAPELADDQVQERALRSVLAQFRYDLSRDTFVYIRERLERTRREARQMRVEAVTLRERARELHARTESLMAEFGGNRTYRDGDGQVWSVRELAPIAPWSRAKRCLVFSSEMAVRRVWDVPSDWRVLSDPELERLSWSR